MIRLLDNANFQARTARKEACARPLDGYCPGQSEIKGELTSPESWSNSWPQGPELSYRDPGVSPEHWSTNWPLGPEIRYQDPDALFSHELPPHNLIEFTGEPDTSGAANESFGDVAGFLLHP